MIPYLKELGISTVYASPLFEATPGSNHGYDALNPHRINPEIGSEEQFRKIAAQLKDEGIGWLQDMVPNHMAFDTRNPWLRDVLEKGVQSHYHSFFDLGADAFEGKLMVPFLGAPLEEVIAGKELKLDWQHDRLVLSYFDSHYPVQAATYDQVLQRLPATQGREQLQQQLKQLHVAENAEQFSYAFEEMRRQFAALLHDAAVHNNLQQVLQQINDGAVLLQEVAEAQHYRLCHWQETDRQINYRRFFTVNGLICLNIQHPHVFDHFHHYLKQLMEEALIDGLRVDHIDGLYDPVTYLQRLKKLSGDETYVVVEKILAPDEPLPSGWRTEGTTGYDFLAMVNNLLTNREAEKPFTQFYFSLARHHRSVPQQVRDKKWLVLQQHMSGELNNLYRLFAESGLVAAERFASIPEEDLKKAVGAFLVFCPVYRFYGNHLPLPEDEATEVRKILCRIREWCPALETAVQLLEDVLLHQPATADASYNSRALHFYRRCMQFSGPLMAKGVEDTLMYTFNRFLAHNEVGDGPEAFGISIDDFHIRMKIRQERWPLALNATSTHDTKRGEDVRARLQVLSDLPGRWLDAVGQWEQVVATVGQENLPDANDRYFIYQTLIGSYPLESSELDNYPERIAAYLQKALREAKHHSQWTTPNDAYEQGAIAFALEFIKAGSSFQRSFEQLLHSVNDFGIVHSLLQVLLKFTCPGVPDTYQGCELWDLCLVDPDNRRPVDYEIRHKALASFAGRAPEDLVKELWRQRKDARIKLWLTRQLMQLRKEQCELFTYGEYLPLKTEGTFGKHILAFARKHKNTWLVVALPVGIARLQQSVDAAFDWKDTKIVLPQQVQEEWEQLLIPKKGKQQEGIRAQEIFGVLPFALLRMQGVDNSRNAGILMHITSLPSPFGIGDLGPEAKTFADFLFHSHQRIWQLLPINPTEAGQAHSPYSAVSSRAGNTLLISPELLVRDRLLDRSELAPFQLPAESKADFEAAARNKQQLFEKAWQRFRKVPAGTLKQEADTFYASEKEWLDDFAMYSVLKEMHGGKPWYEWPEELRKRQPQALGQLRNEQSEALEKAKWLQLLFHRQWKALKRYCNNRNILLLGDLPIYVSYDSADVWSNQEIFKLNEKGEREGIAGVPPDAFSDDGQLWGMPVYRWDKLQESNFRWWVERLKKNTEQFDLVRLDHFRAFADYWEVPAGEDTARNGSWQPGPGAAFFSAVSEQLGGLPFVAEDLGEINDAVRQLRDAFKLPGMKVLQFAFGDELPASEFIPHNYEPNFFVYTGTHDNNTTRGWFRETDEALRHRLREYLAREVNEDDVSYWLAREAFASVAKTVILPLQDLLNLDESARMNLPASVQHNWAWRLLPGQLNREAADKLRKWTVLYNRK